MPSFEPAAASGVLWITPRTRPTTLARFASKGTPIPVRLARSLKPADLLRLLLEHASTDYGEELAQILCSADRATPALLEAALRLFPSDLGVMNSVALSSGASRVQLRKLARSRHRSVREHAKLSLLAASLTGASTKRFLEAVRSANHLRDKEAALYVIVTHPDAPAAVLAALAEKGPDLVRSEALQRLKNRRTRRARR